jgi:uncharacterized protein YciI
MRCPLEGTAWESDVKLAKILLLLLASATLLAAEAPTTEKLIPYQLVVLKKGPEAAARATPEGQQILRQHVEHLYKLNQQGVFKAAGPFTDQGDIQGIIFVAAATPAEALKIESTDPAVQAGVFSMEALPFLSPPNGFGQWAAFGKFERVYFGFLLRGPNRGQDAATAERMQSEHLRYMQGQSQQGKLVVAGPITEESARRGIVVYRVATDEEAKQRAEADPMIKAGRLQVELHPWQVPVGALPSPATPQ